MKENIFKTALSVSAAALLSYIGELAVPIGILCAAMICDYISGMIKASEKGTVSSRTGIKGILKKVGYLIVASVGMVADWLFSEALYRGGLSDKSSYICAFGLLVTVWLIVNELISILENLSAIGVPMPEFLKKALARAKSGIESKGDESSKKAEAPEDTDKGDKTESRISTNAKERDEHKDDTQGR